MRSYFGAALRVAAAVGMVLALSGCIVVPAYGPHYHPYRYYYYP